MAFRAEPVAGHGPEPYVAFPKELFDALLLAPMPGAHKDIVLAVIRRTYGDYGKSAAPISLSLLVQMTGRNHGHLQRALADLRAAGVIRVVKEARLTAPRVLAVNADHETWGRYAPRRPVRGEATGRADRTPFVGPLLMLVPESPPR